MIPHICHVSSVHTGLDIRIARKEASAAAQAGFRTSLVISATEADVLEGKGLGIDVVPIRATYSGSRILRAIFKAKRAMEMALCTGAHLIHIHDPELLPYGLYARHKGRFVVMDVHEDLENQIRIKSWVSPLIRTPLGRCARRLERFAAARLDAVVTVSPTIADYFSDVAQRLVLARNFASIAEFPLPDMGNGWLQRDRVCYVGGISFVRGILGMVRALPIAKVRMLLAGNFHSDTEKLLTMREPGWQWVDYLGPIDRTGIARVFSRSFAGLSTLHPTPNHVSTYPIKLFEYMAAGIPVISSNVPTWRKIVEDERCGLIADHEDPLKIANSILRLKDDRQLARVLGENGRRAVIERYSWESERRNLIELYSDLLLDRPV